MVAIVAVALTLASLGCSGSASVDSGQGAAPAKDSVDRPDPGNGSSPEREAKDTDAGERGDGETGNREDGTAEDSTAGPNRDVPPLVLPTSPPGNDDAYRAMIADLERFLTTDQVATAPWPDLRQTDPIAAYRSCSEFQSWIGQNNPTPTLVEAYTAPNSPERTWDFELYGTYQDLGVISTPADPPYSMQVEGVAHPAATDINDALLARVPEGSVAVIYWDSVGDTSLVTPNGDIVMTYEGWVDVGPWVAIMAPTDVGWQVWWDELTDSNPLGRQGQGGPTVQDDPHVQA